MKTVFTRLAPSIPANFIKTQGVDTDCSVAGSEYLAELHAECKRVANILLEDSKHASLKEIMETPQGQSYVDWLEKFVGEEFPVEEAILSKEPLVAQPDKEKKREASVVALTSKPSEEELTTEQKARRENLPPVADLRVIAEGLGIDTSSFGKARRALLVAIEEAERNLQKASVQQAEEQEAHNLAIPNLEDICVLPVENVVAKAPAKPVVVLPVKLDPEEVVKKISSSKTEDFDLDEFISKEDLNTTDEGDEENKGSDDDDDDDSLF